MTRKLAVILMLCILCSVFSIGHSETAVPAQSILLTGVGNARELGGYPVADGRTVKRGVLLRSAKLRAATDEDIRKLTEEYHLGVVLDLRGAGELENAPDAQIEGVTYRNIDILGEAAAIPEGLLAELEELEAQGIEPDQITQIRLFLKYGLFNDRFLVL